MSLRLTLISHAATKAVRTAAFPLDEPLEPGGHAKAAALAGSLGRIDAAWASPALRARQTADALGIAAAIEPSLADIDLGHWAGKSLSEIEEADMVGLARWRDDPASAPHGGESVEDLLQRVASWLDAIGGAEGRVIAVTHAAVVRAAAIAALDASPKSFWRIDVEPLRFSRLDARDGIWTLRCLNGDLGSLRRVQRAPEGE